MRVSLPWLTRYLWWMQSILGKSVDSRTKSRLSEATNLKAQHIDSEPMQPKVLNPLSGNEQPATTPGLPLGCRAHEAVESQEWIK